MNQLDAKIYMDWDEGATVQKVLASVVDRFTLGGIAVQVPQGRKLQGADTVEPPKDFSVFFARFFFFDGNIFPVNVLIERVVSASSCNAGWNYFYTFKEGDVSYNLRRIVGRANVEIIRLENLSQELQRISSLIIKAHRFESRGCGI